MKLRPDEIANILKAEIERYEVQTDVEEVGTIIQIGDGIARIYGLDRCVALEKLELDHGVTGLALNLEEDNVAAVLFGEWDKIKEGDTVRRTGEVMRSHLLPHLVGTIIVYSTLTVAVNILFEAALSYLGVGLPLPDASWGNLLSEAVQFYTLQPWVMLFPGLAILFTTLAFNLLGDGLRDALDPRGGSL